MDRARLLHRVAEALRIAGLIGFAVVTPTGMLEARKPRSTIEPGIYGNVRMYPETGDLGGIEVQIGPSNQIETTICEGWCNSTYRTTYRDAGRSISYEVQEKGADRSGRVSIQSIAVVLKRSGRHLLAKVQGETEWSVLKRLSGPYGLAIAREGPRPNDR